MHKTIALLFLLYNICCIGENISFNISQTTNTQDTTAVFKLLKLSNQHTVNDPEKAKAYAIECINAARLNGYKSFEISGLYKLGAIHVNQGHREKAKPLFEEGLKKSQELNNQVLIALGFYNLSRFYEMENVLDKALEYLKQSDTIYKTLNIEDRIGYCQTSYGRIYQALGNYDKALYFYFKSLKINENLNNKAGVSVVKTNIGNIYSLSSKFEDALKYFNEALLIDIANNDQEGILINNLNIGEAYQNLKLFSKALKSYETSLDIATHLNYSEDKAILLSNIGSVLNEMESFEPALKSLFSALTIEETHNFNKANTLNEIAKTFIALNKPEKATVYALQAVDHSKATNKINELRHAYLNLSQAYKKQDDGNNAYDALVKSYSIKDSLFSLGKEKQINQLQLTYETEKKEQEILVLQQQKKISGFKRNTFLQVSISIFVILFLLYNRQRLKNKKNHLLFEKEHEVAILKSQFFENVSHEFRTPLTLILGPLQLLKSNISDSKMSRQLGIMERNGERLLTLINKLLDFSKTESGEKHALELENNDIVSIVKGITMSFQSRAEEKQMQLIVVSNLDSFYTYFDLEKLETILINLISNAFKFTPEGGRIKVSLEVIKGKHQKDNCKIVVQDNGQGIPDIDIKNIFNRFHQSTNPLYSKHHGSGIGLALTQELVILHKGSIDTVSKEGKGTTFTVLLPVGEAHFNNTELAIKTIQVNGASQDLIKNTSLQEANTSIDMDADAPILLLIEDNADVMHYLKEILESTYSILEATNGEMGIKMALKQIPDLIISDIMMPKKNGYEVCETLKEDAKTSHIPIILLTARASQDNKMKGLLTKADAYLTKPFVPKELMVRVKNLIESRKQLKDKYKKAGILNPNEIAVNSIDEKFMNRLIELVELHMPNDKFGVVLLSKEIGMSRSQLHRKLNGIIGHGPNQFIRNYRLQRAHDLLKQNAATPSEVSYQVGFGSPSYFTKCFSKHYGYPPSNIDNQTIKS